GLAFSTSGSHSDPLLFPYTTLFRSSQSIFALTHGGLSVKEITNFLKSTTDVQSLLDGIDAKMKEQLVAGLSGSGRSLFTSIISEDRKSTRLNSSHVSNSYAVFFLIK